MYFAIEYLGGRREEEEVVTLFDDASSNDVVRVGNFVPDTYRSMHVCVYKSQWQFLTKYCIPFHFTSMNHNFALILKIQNFRINTTSELLVFYI